MPGSRWPGSSSITTPENWRRVAHIIADAIYERLTGDGGYFDTRIVFVDESGPEGPAASSAWRSWTRTAPMRGR